MSTIHHVKLVRACFFQEEGRFPDFGPLRHFLRRANERSPAQKVRPQKLKINETKRQKENVDGRQKEKRL